MKKATKAEKGWLYAFLITSMFVLQAAWFYDMNGELRKEITSLKVGQHDIHRDISKVRTEVSRVELSSTWQIIDGATCSQVEAGYDYNEGDYVRMVPAPCPKDIPLKKIVELLAAHNGVDVVLEEAKPQGVRLEKNEE